MDSNNKGRALAAAAAMAAGVSAVSSVLITRLLVDTALKRNLPEVSKIIAKHKRNVLSGSENNDDFNRVYEDEALNLKIRPNERIEITAEDGTILVGHWIPVENPKRIVIAMHGWRSSWNKDFGMVSEAWERYGCSVLYAEQRGQSESGGEYMGFGLIERFDCRSWAEWAAKNISSELPIYLAGVSMGATTVLLTSELTLPENVHGIMADCGFTSPDAVWKHIAEKNLHIKYDLKGMMAESMYHHITEEDSRYSTTMALKKTKIPVLFVHGSDDHFVPVSMTFENYAACASEKELLIVPYADHGMSYYCAKESYEAAALKFWKEHD